MRAGFRLTTLALALALSTACGQSAEQSAGQIKIDGSSTVLPISEAVAEEFGRVRRDIKVPVGKSGTGGGFQKFCAGEIDISNASRPIKDSEVALCAQNGVEYIELPIAFDGLAVVVNPQNDWANEITTEELKRLWEPEAQGKVTKWSDIREGWPDKEIHLFGAGVDSGTYDYFTEAIVGKEHSSRGDFTSSEDDNVLVQGIAGDEAALGFFGFAYYIANQDKLKLLPVDDRNEENGAGPVAPSFETVSNGTYQPLSRPVFIYVSQRSLETRPEVAEFVKFYLDHAADLAEEVGYVPLPEKAYTLNQKRVDARKTGSLFESGSQVGVSIEALLERALEGAEP